jgi:hypothetical protein
MAVTQIDTLLAIKALSCAPGLTSNGRAARRVRYHSGTRGCLEPGE